MKKHLLVFAAFLLVGLVPHAFAAVGDACPGGFMSVNNQCVADGSLCDYSDAGTQDGTYQKGRCISNETYGTPIQTKDTGGSFVPLAGIPGLTTGVDTSISGLATFFNNLYKYLIGVAATLAVVEIIWGGFEISTKDSISKQSAGKERITQALFGLVLVLSPVLVFSIINPSILNLSLGIPVLPVKTGAVQPLSFGPASQTSNTAGGQVENATVTGYHCGTVESRLLKQGFTICMTPLACSENVAKYGSMSGWRIAKSCVASSTIKTPFMSNYSIR